MTLLRPAVRVLAALLLLSLLTFVFQRVAARGRFTGAYSSYGGGPRGTRALYLLSQRLGVQPSRWSQDLARLPRQGVLVALGGCDGGMARKLSRYERDELKRWVDAGGVLLVAGARHYLPDSFGVHLEDDGPCSPKWKFGGSETSDEELGDHPETSPPPAAAPPIVAADDDADGGVVVGARTAQHATPSKPPPERGPRWSIPMAAPLLGLSIVPFRKPGRIVIAAGRRHEVLLGVPTVPSDARTSDVDLMGVAVPSGQGKVVLLASASMFQNRDLVAGDGGALFARLLRAYAPAGPVLFDEYHMGVGERRSLMRYLRQMGAMPLALQLLGLCVVLLWRAGARFGAVRQEREAPPRGTASFVAAMAGLYESARDPGGAIDVIVKRALGLIAAHHHLPGLSARKLEQTLRERGAVPSADAVREITEARSKLGTQRTRLAALTQRIDAAVVRATQT